MTPAELWLRDRAQGVPPELLARMLQALPASGGAVPDALVDAAAHLYAAVAEGSGVRADALPLLAADALFTHAFEAQAEIDPEGVEPLVTRCEQALSGIVP